MDRTIASAPPLSRFQFERVGYFCVDSDSTEEKVSVLCQRREVFVDQSLEISICLERSWLPVLYKWLPLV